MVRYVGYGLSTYVPVDHIKGVPHLENSHSRVQTLLAKYSSLIRVYSTQYSPSSRGSISLYQLVLSLTCSRVLACPLLLGYPLAAACSGVAWSPLVCFIAAAAAAAISVWSVAGVLAALGTVGAIVYGSVLNLQDNFEKYEV